MSAFTVAALGVLTAAPSPSPSDVELTDPGAGSPGFLGFVVTFLLAVAAIGLFLSLTKQLRVVDRRAKQLGLDDAAESDADATDESDGPDGAAPGGGAARGGTSGSGGPTHGEARGSGDAGAAPGRDGTR
ncbi:hypothetical protein [Cellulomonas biazotea]|uniref:hypothetical protein n=2 Tax=Cellulomonas biazotea TaxID=1709 RepID=UPI0035E873A4